MKAKRTPRQKVFGATFGWGRTIFRTSSLKKFQAATGIPPEYVCETGNAEEIRVAEGNPDQVMYLDRNKGEWRPIKRKDAA